LKDVFADGLSVGEKPGYRNRRCEVSDFIWPDLAGAANNLFRNINEPWNLAHGSITKYMVVESKDVEMWIYHLSGTGLCNSEISWSPRRWWQILLESIIIVIDSCW
jgi:hypothetical protein